MHSGQAPIDLGDVPAGYAFPLLHVSFPAVRVRAYTTVLESAGLQGPTGAEMVPPASAAALGLGALLERIALPPGTLHAAQEIEVHACLPVGSTVACRAFVTGRSARGGTIFLTLEFTLESPDGVAVLDGKATLLVPSAAGG